jgi:hypothetical protein
MKIATILTIISIFITCAIVNAEILMSPGFTLGLNMANVSADDTSGIDYSDIKNRTGIILGARLDIQVNEMFSVVPGVNLAMRGFKVEEEVPIVGKMSMITRVNYLDLPVLAKVQFDAGVLKPFIAVGPEFGLVLTGEMEMDMFGTGTTSDIKDELNSFDFGLSFNAGAEYDMGKMYPFLQLGYYLGLANMVKDADDGEYMKNKGLVLLTGVRFKM